MMSTQTNTITPMKPSLLATAIDTLTKAKIPIFIWGPPGVGKSQIVAQVAKGQNKALIDVRAVQMDPVDLKGLPHINDDGRAHWAIPDFLPTEGEGVLFLDELNSAPQLVQAACYQLILDRKLGDYELPDGWSIVAAGNNETDRGVTTRMPTPLANRFAHFQAATDVDDWSKWAARNQIRPEVIAFIRFRPELLHSFDPKSGEKAFPTPRSWEFVSNAMNANPVPEIEFQVYAGIVGQAAAAELVGFLRIFRNLPSIDMILMNPDTAKVPDDPATKYALSGALARRADDNNIDRIKTYADRMPAEFTVLTMADAARRCPDIQHTPAFINFGAEYSDIVM